MITRWSAVYRLDGMMIRFYWWPLFHPIGAFKRWLWTRCPECGAGFRFFNWPSSDITEEEHLLEEPQRWFQSERHSFHSRCLTERDRRRRAANGGEW